MSEEENVGVDEAVAEATPEDGSQINETNEAQESERRSRNDAEYNWAEMRRQMREKDQQIEELKQQFTQFASRQPNKEEEDELAKLAEDDILTVAQARKLAQKMAKNVATEVLREREASTAEERVQLKHPDYADVVTKENIELLKKQKPMLAKSLASMSDPYEQALAAYELLKEIDEKKGSSESLEKRKARENSQKPVSVNAVSKNSAIGNAHLFENGLTPELKKQLWKEMQQAVKAG